jgi:predicted TPR repeat methyltransferase
MWFVSTTASVRLSSDDPLARAEALLAGGRASEAADALQLLIEGGRAGLLARLMYARALSQAGELDAALETARETALMFPGIAAVAAGLGEALLRAGKLPIAIAEFQRALRIDPQLAEGRFLLGCAWLEAGEPEKALQAFHEIPADAAASFVLPEKIAEAEQMRALSRSNARYVRHLFDQFATDYDARMIGQLGYSAPHILRELAQLVIPDVQAHSIDILDLGCGTGLTGLKFHDLARRLDGVDLSPSMVEKARARGIYDELAVADVEDLVGARERYDLVLAADTLVYLGDLRATFASVSKQMKPNGFFLFTVEKEAESDDFSLGPKRRWRHSENYLRREADSFGYTMAGLVNCSPRTEAGVPVQGYAVALLKST